MSAAITWWGTLPTWLLVGGIAAAGWYFRWGKGGDALNYLKEANTVLTTRCDELENLTRKQAQVIAALEQRTNLEPMVSAVVDQFASHEQRAAQRQVALLRLIEMVAERLGPDSNGT